MAAALNLAVDYEFVSSGALDRFADQARKEGVVCPTIMAYGCHDLNPLSDPEHRDRFMEHVLEAGRGAAVTGSAGVLTAMYEKNPVAGSRRIAAEIYGALTRELPDVTLLIECLSGTRTAFLPDVSGMASFIDGMRLPGVGLAVDTWHAFNTEKDLFATLQRNAPRIRALHLKDTDSRLPGQGGLDFNAVLRGLRAGGFRGRFTVECGDPGSRAVFEEAIRRLQLLIHNYFP